MVSFNKSISYLKKTLKENLENSSLAASSISNNDFHHDYSEAQWNILQSGLQKLSPQKRRAFQLCKLESKTYKEAAEEMHISKHTVEEYLLDSMADEEYLKVYHLPALEGKFNTSEGIALANKYNDLSDKILKYTMDYIHDNPKSIVAFDQAYYMLEGYTTTLSIPQIDDLVKTISPVWKGTYNLDVFTDASKNSRKTAIGIKYQDFEFQTPDGKKVMLSKYIPKGKFLMIEFWASWCGPCRGEIPHLKHLNETKSDLFSIVSLSLDENDANWQKAMKDEGMV